MSQFLDPPRAPGVGSDEHAVATRWQAPTRGQHYASPQATGRFSSARRRARDGGLVARLLERAARSGAPLGLVLDAPCGTGRLTTTLAQVARRIVAVDVSRAMLQADPGAFGAAPRIEASAFALPFRAAAFDVAVACRILHHFREADDRRAILRELARVSARFVVASYWDAASWHAWRRRAPGGLRRASSDGRVAVSAKALDEDLAAAGLVRAARVHSLRFVSAQTFILAAVERA